MKYFLLIFISLTVFSCNSPQKKARDPQAFLKTYDPYRVSLLKKAADHKLLFQIPDQAFKDFNIKEAGDRCRTVQDPAWVSEVYEILDLFDQNETLFSKVHVVEIKRGDKADIEINKDLDGSTYLTLLYTKKIDSKKEIKSLSEIPCSTQSMDYLGKELSETSYEWPAREKIATFLLSQPTKPSIDRFNFDSRFLIFLAQRQTIFRMTPENSFEKSSDGKPLLVELFKELSENLRPETPTDSFDFWLKEISQNSKQGKNIKFFSLKKDSELSHGLDVKSEGEIQRKISGANDPTWPYISYRVDAGKFVFSNLEKLETCLSKISKTDNSLGRDSQSYLYPGYHCK